VGIDADGTTPRTVTLAAATRVWAKIGWLGFGGPAGQIALMHRELVERRRWISDGRFLHALNYCMLLPGPEAQQLSIYIGWLMHRTAGGVIAGTLFVIPGVIVIGLLSWLYAVYQQVPAIGAIFFGLKAAVLAIVVEAVLRIGKRALKSRTMVAIAAAAFIGIYFLKISFPLIVLGAGATGLILQQWRPQQHAAKSSARAADSGEYYVDGRIARGELAHLNPSLPRALRIAAVCLALWFAPLVAVIGLWGGDSVFAQLGIFFSQAAVVTFGGAYAVLAYVAQQVVAAYGWLVPGEMVDGLALAETTPGPLIMVVQYVAFLAAFRHPGGFDPLLAAIIGALLTSWVTFVPCFLWVFVGAPYVEALRNNRALNAALSAITAAIVGVILNLSVWFTLHSVFRTQRVVRVGPLDVELPVWSSLDPFALLLAAAALAAMLRFRLGLGWTLAGAALIGAAGTLLRG